MNYKIKVGNEAESKEAQELFFELGYKDRKNWTQRNPIHESIQAWADGEFTFSLNHNQLPVGFKEITLPELRDLAVLKRNDVGDYTHGSSFGSKFYYCCNGDVYAFNNGAWVFDHTRVLKPIEKKEMKEYLVKNENTGAYDLFRKYPDFSGESDIEIPEGAEEYKANGKFYKENSSLFYSSAMEWVSSKLKKDAYPALWQRHTQPEELPFIDIDYFNPNHKKEWTQKILSKVPHDLILDEFKQPEELPFIDNEPSLNDRKSAVFGRALNLPDFEPFKPDSLINEEIKIDTGHPGGDYSKYTPIFINPKYPQPNRSDINFRVAKAFNEIRGTDLTEDDIHFLRELINSVTNHYGE